jgi:hypothetical protein
MPQLQGRAAPGSQHQELHAAAARKVDERVARIVCPLQVAVQTYSAAAPDGALDGLHALGKRLDNERG